MKFRLKNLKWLVPYLVAGFSAPFIFKNAPNYQIAGRIAGALFLFAGAWALFTASKFRASDYFKGFVGFFFLLELLFWGWRFNSSVPLRESALMGINGGDWHHMLTALYLIVAACLAWNLVKNDSAQTVR